ncbi:hypothetical protein A2678_00500 [Candidatus Kaiserbacteria bacterium RIFCSPHIGHO2_01_FULL_53_31]|uniref:HhH-GPD domain-containing protein n=1 Tax=Candidatus Kaiserbacteria bacterium RIFCSPHIGHO2_01_FULL_53_31 TaxID=1798481 RepID=A0A1F6CHX3_9BACT|nr:MAG: hypothetical protein A2678_00500 [Candidatus Kaiserbacteria bacterium RIFCSPHIGHO2_01_FULL_53_31]
MSYTSFKKIIWAHCRKHGRHDLPWRQTHDLYRILVSEVMLQQTQVERVIPFYKAFIKKFPTARRLAQASLSDVLKAWQGLGYNRRAKLLREATQQLVHTTLSGTRLNLIKKLEELSGVGPYTARAVAAFAFNQDVIFIETNIRTVITHHFFQKRRKVSDKEIEKILTAVLPKGKSREWYSALMDYGAYLKRSGIKLNTKSKHYAKQSAFAGSSREARGAILRVLSTKESTAVHLTNLLGPDRCMQTNGALEDLVSENLVKIRRGVYSLAD